MVGSALRPRLKALGFQRKGRNFCRRGPEVVAYAGVQSSQWNSGAAGSFTVNLGVYFPAIVPLLHGEEPVDFPADYHCEMPLRIRLPQLAFGQDRWWEIDAADAIARARAGASLGEAWDEHAMAWLTERSDPRCARDACLSHPIHAMVASALSVVLGEREEARRHLATALSARDADRTTDADYLRRTFPAYASDEARLQDRKSVV